ncbi:MAG: hypothetical protein JST84_11715 [Acidobacteria bacterium]|nr:hypothetical protein [Acidobacteriota bacterium]
MNWEKLTFPLIAILLLPFFFVFVPSKEWVAVILIFFSFFLLFSSRYIRSDSRLLWASFFVLALRHGISIINVYFTKIYGAGLDATTFHLNAIEIARSTQPTWFSEFGTVDIGSSLYARSLGFCYKYLGESLLLGQTLSVLAYVVAGILLIRLMGNLGLSRWKRGIILLYGGLPPAIIYESITMREPWEALFFILVCYSAVQLRKQVSIWRMIVLVGFGVALGLLHNGLMVYALFLVCYSLFWGGRINLANWRTNNLLGQLIAIPLLIGIVLAWWNLARDVGGASQALIKGETANYYETYREKGEQDARANYEVRLDTSSIPSAVGTGFLAFIFYLFAPFPWQVSSLMDLYAFSEGVFRFFLLYQGIKLWWRSSGERRSKFGYLLTCVFSLELLWSFGTTNWGTATRHHIIAYGLLVVVGGPGVMLAMMNLGRRLTRRTSKRKARVARFRSVPRRRIRPMNLPSALPPDIPNVSGK